MDVFFKACIARGWVEWKRFVIGIHLDFEGVLCPPLFVFVYTSLKEKKKKQNQNSWVNKTIITWMLVSYIL
jgi:hypothetical protein